MHKIKVEHSTSRGAVVEKVYVAHRRKCLDVLSVLTERSR
jgi:hypothetical protein